jgi:prefoldin subunit 5
MNKDCAICCESFNLSTRKEVNCENPECNLDVCKSCTRTYLLSTTSDPHCMNCKHGFENNFLTMNLDRTFMEKEFKTNRKKIMLEREISKLPETMGAVENIKKIEKLKKNNDEIKEIIKTMKEEIRKLETQKYHNEREIDNIKRNPTKNKSKFIMACQVENCRGYLNTSYRCELCKNYTCSKCLEVIGDCKEETHVCDEDKVKTTEMIKNSTKPCPGCGERIYKIEGCDQMWCTGCHTAFSWKTGLVDNGTVHNPHYFQMMRNNGGIVPRNPNDVLCGGMPNFWDIRRRMRRVFLVTTHINQVPSSNINEKYKGSTKVIEIITSFNRQIQHITHVSLVNVRENVNNNNNYEELRVNYILNRISKDKLASEIFRKDKLRKKNTDMLHLFELISVVGIDFFRWLNQTTFDLKEIQDKFESEYNKTDKKNKLTIEKEYNTKINDGLNIIKKKLEEIENFRQYINKEFEKISVTYNNTVNQVKENWTIENKKFSLSKYKKNNKNPDNIQSESSITINGGAEQSKLQENIILS